MKEKIKKYRELYQHLCDAQDIAESIGLLSIMYDISTLRRVADGQFYSTIRYDEADEDS